MDNEASSLYIENMPEPRMAYIPANRQLFENTFEIAARTSFNSTAKISLKLSSKNKQIYLHGETGVGKTKLAKKK